MITPQIPLQKLDTVTPPAETSTAEAQRLFRPKTVKKLTRMITAAAGEERREKRTGYRHDIAGKTGTYRPDSLSKELYVPAQRLDIISPPAVSEQSRKMEVERQEQARLTSDNAQPASPPMNEKTLKLVLRFSQKTQSNSSTVKFPRKLRREEADGKGVD